jgi:hypothetical protein
MRSWLRRWKHLPLQVELFRVSYTRNDNPGAPNYISTTRTYHYPESYNIIIDFTTNKTTARRWNVHGLELTLAFPIAKLLFIRVVVVLEVLSDGSFIWDTRFRAFSVCNTDLQRSVASGFRVINQPHNSIHAIPKLIHASVPPVVELVSDVDRMIATRTVSLDAFAHMHGGKRREKFRSSLKPASTLSSDSSFQILMLSRLVDRSGKNQYYKLGKLNFSPPAPLNPSR